MGGAFDHRAMSRAMPRPISGTTRRRPSWSSPRAGRCSWCRSTPPIPHGGGRRVAGPAGRRDGSDTFSAGGRELATYWRPRTYCCRPRRPAGPATRRPPPSGMGGVERHQEHRPARGEDQLGRLRVMQMLASAWPVTLPGWSNAPPITTTWRSRPGRAGSSSRAIPGWSAARSRRGSARQGRARASAISSQARTRLPGVPPAAPGPCCPGRPCRGTHGRRWPAGPWSRETAQSRHRHPRPAQARSRTRSVFSDTAARVDSVHRARHRDQLGVAPPWPGRPGTARSGRRRCRCRPSSRMAGFAEYSFQPHRVIAGQGQSAQPKVSTRA